MLHRLLPLLAVLCLGCAEAQEPAVSASSVDPAPIEAVRPAGPYAVGTTDGPVVEGGVATRIFYPASAGGEARPGGFSTDHRIALERRFGAAAAEALARAVTAARWDAPPAEGRFPLVVFQPGASMAATDYRLLLEAVASRGYVVVAVNPQGSPPVSGQRYPAAAGEMARVVAEARSGRAALAKADATKVAFIGHSLGGAAAVMALAQVPNAVAVNLDGDFGGGAVRIPADSAVLDLIGQTDGENARSRARRTAAWREASAGARDATVLQVVDLRHFDFADVALIQDGVPEGRRRTRFGEIGGAKAHALTIDLTAAFLDSRLKGDASAWPAALARHPEAAAPSTW